MIGGESIVERRDEFPGRDLVSEDMHQHAFRARVLDDLLRVGSLRGEIQGADVDLDERHPVAHAGAVQHEFRPALAEPDPVLDLDALDFDRSRANRQQGRGNQGRPRCNAPR